MEHFCLHTIKPTMKLSSEEYQRVLNFFKKMVQAEPTKWSYWCDIGFCYGKLGRWREAVTAFEQILDKDEATASVLNMLGHAYIKLENYHEAAIILDRAHAMAPGNLSVLYKMAMIHFHRGEIEMALNPLQQVILHKPQHLKAQYSLGLIYHRLNDRKAADRQIAIVKALNQNFGEQLAEIVQGCRTIPPPFS